jgi:hypothetical protein
VGTLFTEPDFNLVRIKGRGRSFRVVGNTDISTRLLEISGLPVIRPELRKLEVLCQHGSVSELAMMHKPSRKGGTSESLTIRHEEDKTGYMRRVTRPVATSAAAQTKSKLNHALRRSARPSFR